MNSTCASYEQAAIRRCAIRIRNRHSGPRFNSRAQTQRSVNVAVTETSDTHDPYGDSNSLMYGVWCHVYGCLIQYDFDKADYVGLLAQSWETPDPKTWIFICGPTFAGRMATRAGRRCAAFVQPGYDRSEQQAEAELEHGRQNGGDRRSHRQGDDQRANGAAVVLSHAVYHHQQIGVRQIRTEGSRRAASGRRSRIQAGTPYSRSNVRRRQESRVFPGMQAGRLPRTGSSSRSCASLKCGGGSVQRRISDCPTAAANLIPKSRAKSEHQSCFSPRR